MREFIELLESATPLSSGLKEHLLQLAHPKTLSKKQYLLRAGQVCRQICFISKGLLRAYYMKGDTEVSCWFMQEEDIVVSITSFYQQKISYEYIQAMEATDLYYITYQELADTYAKFPELERVGRLLTVKYLIDWTEQMYSIRMRSAQERLEWLMNNRPELMLRIPAKYIASYLDITEVTFSKMKSRLQAAMSARS